MDNRTWSSDPAALEAADGVEVLVLVDNVSDLLSTVPASVTPEIPNLLKAGMKEISGEGICCAHWGLSLVITAQFGDRRRTLLFDSGPEGYAVERNGARLGIDFGRIEAVVLSHGHWDHSGGMPAALRRITAANGGRRVPVHVNPGMFVKRASRRTDGRLLPFKDVPSEQELAEAGGEVVNAAEARLLLDGMFYLSGEIPRVTPYERGYPSQVRLAADGRTWEPDPWIMDERFVAVRVRDKGIIVFTACSHAGVVNVLRHARELFAPVPLHAVMGGFHLSGADCEPIIPETVADLKDFGLNMIVAGHCTGWRAVRALVDAFGEEVVAPSAVGRLYAF